VTQRKICVGGTKANQPCGKNADCPGGACTGTRLDYNGKFKIGTEVKNALDLTDADKKTLGDDFNRERSTVMKEYPGQLSFILPPRPPDDSCPTCGILLTKCDRDADRDGVTNAADNCPTFPNSDQADSIGNGVGDICRTPQVCDVDGNGVIDSRDISYILAARGLPAAGPDPDPRDANGDGVITIDDARICTLRCTRTGCQ